MNRKIVLTSALLALVMLAGASYYAWQHSGQQAAPASSQAGSTALMQASLKDLAGKMQPLAQWRGKVIVVNFWATWCPPCREEIPEFIKLQEKYHEHGLIFVGIALDQQDKVQAFADETGINYPVLLGELEAIDLAKKSGNRLGGLPFTVVLDRHGNIAATEMGELKQARLESLIKPLL